MSDLLGAPLITCGCLHQNLLTHPSVQSISSNAVEKEAFSDALNTDEPPIRGKQLPVPLLHSFIPVCTRILSTSFSLSLPAPQCKRHEEVDLWALSTTVPPPPHLPQYLAYVETQRSVT